MRKGAAEFDGDKDPPVVRSSQASETSDPTRPNPNQPGAAVRPSPSLLFLPRERYHDLRPPLCPPPPLLTPYAGPAEQTTRSRNPVKTGKAAGDINDNINIPRCAVHAGKRPAPTQPDPTQPGAVNLTPPLPSSPLPPLLGERYHDLRPTSRSLPTTRGRRKKRLDPGTRGRRERQPAISITTSPGGAVHAGKQAP